MNPCDRILRGFECVLNDEDFKINNPKAKCAIETAQSLMSWSSREENVKELAKVRVSMLQIQGYAPSKLKHYLKN